jgi:hypothetical protein
MADRPSRQRTSQARALDDSAGSMGVCEQQGSFDGPVRFLIIFVQTAYQLNSSSQSRVLLTLSRTLS